MPHAPFDWHMEQLESFVGLAFDEDMKKFKKQDALLEKKIAHLDLDTEEGKGQLLKTFEPLPYFDEGFCERNGLSMTQVRAFTVSLMLADSPFDHDWKDKACEVLRQIGKEEQLKMGASKSDTATDIDDGDDSSSDDLPVGNLGEGQSGQSGTAGQALEEIHERWRHFKTLPIDIFIDIVHDSLQKEYLDIQFDYFAFFRSAFSLMQDIQEKIKPLFEPYLSEGMANVKERLEEPEGAVSAAPQMALLTACNPFEAPNILALRNWLNVDTRALRAAASVMKPWIKENGDIYCVTEEDREEKRTEDILKEGPKVHYFDSGDETAAAPVVRKAENRKVGWSSALGMIEGLNAREMREVYDAMKDDDPMGPTVAETIARLKGTQLSDADREAAEANRAAVREMEDLMRQRQRERGEVSDASDELD